MRSLTIQRTKRFTGCFGKVSIYIEDAQQPDLEINKVPCRKLGDLKNGEQKSFPVGTGSFRIFAVSDKLSRNWCNEFMSIPAGEEDIFLKGGNHYNLFAGNPFRFEGNTEEAALRNRKKGSRKGLWIILISALVGGVVGYGCTSMALTAEKPAQFSVEEMTITLTSRFSEMDMENYNACFGAKDAAVYVLKEPFAVAQELEEMTLEEYGQVVLEVNGLSEIAQLQQDAGLTYFEYLYTNEETNETFAFFSTLYKSADSFWMVQFALPEDTMNNRWEEVISWAQSVSFSEPV